MILALAALVFQFPAIPQNWNLKASPNTAEASAAVISETAAKAAVAPASEAASSADRSSESGSVAGRIVDSRLPATDFRPAALSLEPQPRWQDRSPQSRRRKWLALMIAQHSAATFDAWSTRQAISSGRYQELNPVLKPFAENASLYVAIQVGPLLFDYMGRRMMTSQHAWLRHAWWIPQAVSTAMSLGSGAYNLSAH